MPTKPSDTEAAFRLLPAVDQVLRDERVALLEERVGRALLTRFASEVLERWRAEIKSAALSPAALGERLARGAMAAAIEQCVLREDRAGLVRCINATGVVLNTGLGRAPVHPEAAARMAEAARSYCVLEVDRATNERNQRDERISELCARLLGVEAAIAVNNNAGAVLLVFQTFAGGREAIVSRGELVEIGGSFRVPDVMARANARLVEVGTTNRTRIADYAAARGADTGLLVKVHTSNFRVVGFVEEVAAGELALLGRAHGVTTAFDLGSGLIELADGPALGPLLGGEPLVRAAVASGVDVVCFSGDKLLGASQAGLIVGKRAAIEALRKNPIYRALRLDKVAIAGLECTLELLLDGRGEELPVRRMLAEPAESIRPQAEALAARLARLPGLSATVVPEESEPGSGSAPGVSLATFAVRCVHRSLSANALARGLRAARVPVFVRIAGGAVLVDPRTLLPGDQEDLVAGFVSALEGA